MRFVLLHHAGWPGHADHYDLMVEMSEGKSDDDVVLKTWASVNDVLPDGVADSILTKLPDHRKAYLQYEGAISNSRGHVVRADEGTVTILKGCDDSLGQEWALELRGAILSGVFLLSSIGQNMYKLKKKT